MFASRPHDPDTGLIDMRARWYSPDIGRFLSPDPAGLVDGTNLYAYASNDPVNFFDPSGLARQATQDNPGLGNPNLSEILHEILTKIPGAEALLSLNITGDDLLDAAELFLGIVGLVPAVGMIADGLSVAIAAARGNYGSALLSAAAFIPAIGMAAGGAKIAKIGARLGPKVVRAVKAIAKKSVGKLTKVFKRTPRAAAKFVDTDVLVAATRGDEAALAAIRNGETFVTPNQFREFLAGGKGRKAFLEQEGIQLFGGPAAGRAASGPGFQGTFKAVSRAQGRGDAALAAFAKETGIPAVTKDKRLVNFITQTLRDPSVPITRLQ